MASADESAYGRFMADTSRWKCVTEAAMKSDPADAQAAADLVEAAQTGTRSATTDLFGADGPWTGLDGDGYDAISTAATATAVHTRDMADAARSLHTVLEGHVTAATALETDSDTNHTDAQAAFTDLETAEGEVVRLGQLIGWLNRSFRFLDPVTEAGAIASLRSQLGTARGDLSSARDDVAAAEAVLDGLQADWDALVLREEQLDADTAVAIAGVRVPTELPAGVTVGSAGPTIQVDAGEQVYVFETTDPDTGDTVVVITKNPDIYLDHERGRDIDLDDSRIEHVGDPAQEITLTVDTSTRANVITNVFVGDGVSSTINVDVNGDPTDGDAIFIQGDAFTGDVNITGAGNNQIGVGTEGDVNVSDVDGGDVYVFSGDDISIDAVGSDNLVVVVEGGNVDIDIRGDGENEIEIDDVDANVDIDIRGDGENEITINDVGSAVSIDTGDGDQVIDVDDAGTVDVETGNGNDTISATNITSTVTIDSGGATSTNETNDDGDEIVAFGGDSINVEAGGDVDVSTGTSSGPIPGVDFGDGTPVNYDDGEDSISISSTKGDVTVDSGDRNDSVTITSAIDADVSGGNGRDEITVSGVHSADIDGGSNNDSITVSADTTVTVEGGTGTDNIRVEDATHAEVRGGTGDDNIDTYGADEADVFGDDGHDYIRTGNGDDTVHGGVGQDTIYGGGGTDTLYGGSDSDYIDGGHGDDTIRGGTGEDIVSGGHGDDHLYGGADDDVLIAGAGSDNLFGEGGNDTAYHQVDDVVDADVEDQGGDNISDIPDDFDPDTDITRIEVVGTDNFIDRGHDDLNTLRAIPESAEGLQSIEEAEGASGEQHMITIEELPDEENGFASPADSDDAILDHDDDGWFWTDGSGDIHQDDGSDATVKYNPAFNTLTPTTGSTDPATETPPVVVLYHELAHASDDIRGTLDRSEYTGPDANDNDSSPNRDRGVNNTERDAVGLPVQRDDGTHTDDQTSLHDDRITENGLRDALGLPSRDSYR